jgi:nickel superoxide dismutase
MLHRILAPRRTVHAHCDLPCGVYDPAQGQKLLDAVDEIAKVFWETKS